MLTKNLNLQSNNHNLKLKSSDLNLRSYSFSLDIIKFINSLPNTRAFFSLGDQLLRSGTSIGANIREAKASSSRKDFINFYQIALKSANETIYWLSLLKDSYPALGNDCSNLIIEAKEISSMLGKSLITLKSK